MFTPEKLRQLLPLLLEDYRVLEIDDHRIFSYRTRYFDTEGLDFYLDHHSGKLNRHKVRFRTYVETGATFLEIKFKNNKGRTIKNRMIVADQETVLSQESKAFIREISGIRADLIPVLENRFSRITLVNKTKPERVTLDFNMSFHFQGKDLLIDDLCVAEVKQERFDRLSPIMTALKAIGCYPDSISKYCLGVAMGLSHVKHNRFKQKLIKIQKLQNEHAA